MGSITCKNRRVITLQWLPREISIPEVNPKVNMFPWATKVYRRVGRPQETASLDLGTSEVSCHLESLATWCMPEIRLETVKCFMFSYDKFPAGSFMVHSLP